MKNFKYLILCLFVLSLGLISCNKNNSNPINIPLPVIETFNPVMKEVFIHQDVLPYKQYTLVVNSISELPNDTIFSNDVFLDYDIDFSKYSLIIFYNFQFGKILSTRYSWGYDTDLEQYYVSIRYEIEKYSNSDEEIEKANYVRGAMLVDYIPQQQFVGQSIGVSWIDPE